jgi:Outer membrane protein beta-barrel domain
MKQSILLLFFAAGMNAQHLSYGFKIGAPITDIVEGKGNVTASTTRMTIGPMFDIRLPMGLGIEADALYKRFSANSGSGNQSAGSWEFPILGKYRMPGIIARPYAEAGFTFNKLGSIAAFKLEDRKGIVLGAGVDVSLPKVHIAPEIRYTRFNQKTTFLSLIPNVNQAEFLVGISF